MGRSVEEGHVPVGGGDGLVRHPGLPARVHAADQPQAGRGVPEGLNPAALTGTWSRHRAQHPGARSVGLPSVCILCVVTRLNVYLPDELAAEAKKAGLNLSAVTQEAVRRTLAERSTDAWLARVAATSATERVPHDHALDALDAAREEAQTHHA
jgi:post-segregation antitoxin (ccd killing protein)